MKSAFHAFLFVGLCALIPSCAQALRLNQDYTLAYGERMEFRIKGLKKDTLQFQWVVEDSRCPEGVQCVQAGRALVQLAAGDSSWVMQEGEERIYKNRKIRLKSLLPYPNAADTVPPGPDNYRIVLRFAAGH
jgi:hypothetical protein